MNIIKLKCGDVSTVVFKINKVAKEFEFTLKERQKITNELVYFSVNLLRLQFKILIA